MIVMKFGGTSIQDAGAIANVVEIIKAHLPRQPVVVISAIAQATNMLERAGKVSAEGRSAEAIDILNKLFDRHIKIVDELISNKLRHQHLRNVLETSFKELEELIKGVTILHELTPRSLDSFYCYGELLSSRIVSAALLESGVTSEWLDTKDFMFTDSAFNCASPLTEVVEARLKGLAAPLIAKGVVPVTQGFIGGTQSGQRTTMGRESSDYSASIIGSVLNAQDIQIWTDVDGVLTADPTIVNSPKKIKVLSFEEAYELSYFGAKVLHPNTMLPAFEKNIPIYIYNSRHPNLCGTKVMSQSISDKTIVKSVAYKRPVVILNVTPKKRYSQYFLWEHIYSTLTKYDAVARMTVTSEHSYSLVLDAKNNISAIVHELQEIGLVQIMDGKAIVSVVGSNLRSARHIVDRIFRSVAEVGVEMISFGASKSNLSFVIDDHAVPEVVRRIHTEFFESLNDNDVFEMLEPNQI